MAFPVDIIKIIGKSLDNKTLVELSLISKFVYKIFKDELWEIRLWNYVMDGEILAFCAIENNDAEFYALICEFDERTDYIDLLYALKYGAKSVVNYISNRINWHYKVIDHFVEMSTAWDEWENERIIETYDFLKSKIGSHFFEKIITKKLSPLFSAVIINNYFPEFRNFFMLRFLSSTIDIDDEIIRAIKIISTWNGFNEIITMLEGHKQLLNFIDKNLDFTGRFEYCKILYLNETTIYKRILSGRDTSKFFDSPIEIFLTGLSIPNDRKRKIYEEIGEQDYIKFAIKFVTKYPHELPNETDIIESGKIRYLLIFYYTMGESKFRYYMNSLESINGNKLDNRLFFGLVQTKFPEYLSRLQYLCFKSLNYHMLKLICNCSFFTINIDIIETYLNFRDRNSAKYEYLKLKFIRTLSKFKYSNLLELLIETDSPLLVIKYAIIKGAPIKEKLLTEFADWFSEHLEIYNFILSRL